MKPNNKKNLIIFIVLISITSTLFSLSLALNYKVKFNKNSDTKLNITPLKSSEFNILNFWQREIKRVNSTDLNLEFGKNSTLKYTNPYTDKKYEFTAQEITFNSPNWVDEIPSTISIEGYLLYPEKFDNKNNPACLCMHGLNGNANQSREIAYSYLEKQMIVLTFSFPGHGKSGGPRPSHENFFYSGDFNKSCILYLTICAAIQGLRVLENLSIVDDSKIMVAGGSFGALHVMYLSGICGERICGAQPIGAVGDLKKALKDPTKLIFWLFDKKPEEIPESFWTNQNLRIDPMYYLKSSKVPPCLFMISTNDEFFHYHQINGTFDAIPNENKFIQIYPNEHHSITNHQNTTKFFIDYIIFNGSAPPNIDVKDHQKEMGFFGTNLKVSVKVDSQVKIKSVQVCYKFVDIIGAFWKTLDLKEIDTDKWSGIITPGIITSKLEFFIIVNLEDENQVWFSSKIYTAGTIISYLTIPFYAILIAFFSLPILFIIRRRYKKEIKDLDAEIQKKAKKMFTIEIILISTVEFFFYISLFLPWIVLEAGGVTWNHIYIFNNIFTWKSKIGAISIFLMVTFIVGWIINTHLSYFKPILSGFCKLWYPILVFIIFAYYLALLRGPNTSSSASIFGAGYPGIGLYLMLCCAIFPIIIGIWKRKYQLKLGLKKSKTNK
ncbi:MAG: alpha/beta hydrolase family protein [Promethearchaeota archaeon]